MLFCNAGGAGVGKLFKKLEYTRTIRLSTDSEALSNLGYTFRYRNKLTNNKQKARDTENSYWLVKAGLPVIRDLNAKHKANNRIDESVNRENNL